MSAWLGGLIVVLAGGLLAALVGWALARAEIRRLRADRGAVDARWTQLLEGAGDGVWEWNTRTRAAAYSPRWKAMLGYRADELPDTGRAWAERLHPDDRQAAIEAFTSFADGKRDRYQVEYRLRCQDGSYKWIRDLGIVVSRGADGRPELIVGTHTDATETHQTQERLARSEAAYRMLFDSNPEALWVCDLQTLRFLAVNQAALDRYGYGRDEFLSMTTLDIRPAQDAQRIRDWLASTLNAQPDFIRAGTWLHRKRSGELFQVEVLGQRILFDGRPAALTMARDLTAQLLAERALRESEDTLRAIFEQAGIGVALTDSPAMRILRINPKCVELLGHSVAELLDTDLSSLTHPDDVAADREPMQQVISGERRSHSSKRRLRRRDGGTLWAQVTVSSMQSANREIRHHIVVIEDITERVRFEHSEQARLSAETANQAKTAFLSRMSHELRTPLNAMLGFAQLLLHNRTDPLGRAHRETVANIERAGWHLLDMINEMLDLTLIESGRMQVSLVDLPLAPAIREVVALLAPLADERGVRVELSMADGDDVGVRADSLRLRQVLSNLLSNAIKYNRRGGRVHVGITRHDDETWVSLRDEGDGLSAGQLPHLFEPFNRLGAERSGVEGLGLGLAISRSLVELMRGRIELVSTPGAGSTFTVRLPAAALAAAPSLVAPPARVGLAPAGMRAGRVLYVEDNESNVELVRSILSLRPSLELVVARSLAEGLSAAHQQVVDLALVDLNLPDGDGLDLIDRLRADPRTRELRCIALSADATEARIASARARGVQDYWTKPIDVARFVEAIDRLLAQPPIR